MTPRSSALFALALLLAGAVVPVGAEEPVAPTPAERMAGLLASLPKPGPGLGFSFAGELVDQESVVGTLSMSVEPVAPGGAGAWQAVDEMGIGPKGEIVHVRSEALLDGRMMGIEGRTVAEIQDEPKVIFTWKRVGAGYDLTRQEGEAPATSTRLESAPTRVPTMAALVFLALRLPAEGGAYAVDVLLVDANMGEDPSRRARTQEFTPLGVGPVEIGGVPSKLPRVALSGAFGADDARTLVLAQDLKGLVQVNRPDGRVMMRLPPATGPFDFAAPARTPQGAALKAARAFAVADMAALDAVLNWPSIDANLATNPEFSALDAPARRKKLLEEMGANLEPNAVGTIEMVLRGLADSLQVEDLGRERARVTFPELFRGMKLVVKKVGEVWLLDELPAKV